MTSEWIDAKNENVIDLNDEIDHQYKKKTKSQISKPPKPTGRGKSKTKEEEVQGNQNIPSDPYRLIENPQQKCCREGVRGIHFIYRGHVSSNFTF